jgi:hypothetical protein
MPRFVLSALVRIRITALEVAVVAVHWQAHLWGKTAVGAELRRIANRLSDEAKALREGE